MSRHEILSEIDSVATDDDLVQFLRSIRTAKREKSLTDDYIENNEKFRSSIYMCMGVWEDSEIDVL